MEYVCDAPGERSWFRLVSEAEAATESALMGHAVEKHFRRAVEQAAESYAPGALPFIEQDIGRAAHIRRTMPHFLTLRDMDGTARVTAMLRPAGGRDAGFCPVVVGRDNSDPYPEYGAAIEALARHYGITLDRALCYPYRR